MTSLSHILLTLFFVIALSSCGKNQVIGDTRDQAIFSTKQEAKFFTYVDDNQLRKNILNAFVENSLGEQRSKDWLNLYTESEGLREFTRSKIPNAKNYSRLFVSYSDRTEIYFIPEKTALDSIEVSLGLERDSNSDSYRYFSWLIKDDSAIALKDYVLVNLNHSDLMENDKHFYVREIEINGAEDLIEVVNGSLLNVEIEYEMFKQGLHTINENGKTLRCSSDMRESEGCGCSFNINVPNNSYAAVSMNDLKMLDFDFKINDALVTLKNMAVKVLDENKLSIDVDFSEHYGLIPTFKLEKKYVQIAEVVQGFNYYGNCSGGEKKTIQRRLQSNLKVSYKLFGRGESLRQIKL